MTHALRLLAGVLTIALAALCGCRSRPVFDPSCTVTDPCGGDVVGTWAIQRMCALASPGANCTGSWAFEPALTYVFRADGTFTLSGKSGGIFVSYYSGSCFADGGALCGQLDEEVQKGLLSLDAFQDDSWCLHNDVMCSCDYRFDPRPLDPISGTYQVDGATLQLETTTAAGTVTDSSGYCVSGSSLHLVKPLSADGGAANGPNDVALVRR